MLAAIEALSELQVIKCMVLADMGELGKKSHHSHRGTHKSITKKWKKFSFWKRFAKASQKLRVGFHCVNDNLLINEIVIGLIDKSNLILKRGCSVV